MPDGRTASYTYDPFGRRIKKQVGTETAIYLYADEGLIGEYTTAGTATKTYGWRPGGIWGTNPVFKTENGNYYFYHNDHLGTPQSMTDAAGDIVWEATYEVFGKAAVASESIVTNNLRFAGQYFDEETNLHYNWNRYYEPATGRYISKDPIGFDGGDYNLHKYVFNNPLMQFDNEGLASSFPQGAIDTRDCHYKKEYDAKCMSNCAMDVALNKGITSIPIIGPFIPSKVHLFDSKEPEIEYITLDGGTQALLNTADLFSSKKIEQLSAQYERDMKYAKKSGKGKKAKAAVKRAEAAKLIIKNLGPIAIIATAFDLAMIGNDLNECLSKCKLSRR